MATFKRSFGSNTKASPADSTRPTEDKTPSKATGDVNKEVWAEAESQLKSTFAGMDDEAKKNAIQARYDSMVASDKQVKAWAGGDTEILGDIGQK